MFFTQSTFIGVDPTAGEKPMVYAALDHELHLQALSVGSLDDVLAFACGQKRAVLAVCGPRRPNLGLMKDPEWREKLSPIPAPGRWENFRVAEYQLRQHNILIPHTQNKPELCPHWMQQSFILFARLVEMGYTDFPNTASERYCLEIYPHAAFSILLGCLPFPKDTLEGRLQRQLVLYEREIKIQDPMRFFEEITRHRLLKGILPLDSIHSPAELDALVAAYCAWITVLHPDRTTLVGEPEEGQILLPDNQIKEHYSQIKKSDSSSHRVLRQA